MCDPKGVCVCFPESVKDIPHNLFFKELNKYCILFTCRMPQLPQCMLGRARPDGGGSGWMWHYGARHQGGVVIGSDRHADPSDGVWVRTRGT